MSQEYTYPSSALSSNPSVGVNGNVAPTSSTEVAGVNPTGDLQPLQTNSAGALLVDVSATGTTPIHVIVDSSALPAGASTAANQTTGNTSLATIATNTTGVATAANQTTGNASLATIASNTTGVATASNQSTQITALNALNARLPGGLVPLAFDEVDLTYVPSGNGVGQVATAVYKLSAATVKTLTMSYDSSSRLSSVVAS